MQRYKFESKSQPVKTDKKSPTSCKRICKDTNLKANHNMFKTVNVTTKVVSVYAKIQI